MTKKREPLPPHKCAREGCEVVFVPKRKWQMYHSEECRLSAYRQTEEYKESLLKFCRKRYPHRFLPTTNKTCSVCGAVFVPRRYTQVCCSDTCRQRKRRRELASLLPDRTCPVCGAKVEGPRGPKVYCSEKCRRLEYYSSPAGLEVRRKHLRKRYPPVPDRACHVCRGKVKGRKGKVYCSEKCMRLGYFSTPAGLKARRKASLKFRKKCRAQESLARLEAEILILKTILKEELDHERNDHP